MLINNSAFLITEIPNLNPITQRAERINWWKEQKRRCMEGHWVGNVWCPGELYHYVNFWTIAVGKRDGKKGKIAGRPWFRDVEWEKAFIATEAFGFSGFADDTEYTCDERYNPKNIANSIELGEITLEESRKLKYMPTRDYLRRNYPKPLGKPLYLNENKNVIDIEARGGGKSYWGSNLIQHHFAFDGMHDYDEYLELRNAGTPEKSETLVGAIQAKYSSDLLAKWKFGFDRYPGKYTIYDFDEPIIYPSPLSISVKGSVTNSNDTMTSLHSGSLLHHRTFQDDAFAANGTRPYRIFLEEIGFFHRLIETLGHMRDLTYDGGRKQGTIWMFGTGGDMEGGSTLAAQEVFYNPESYDCLTFEDEWEGRGKIGFFLPAEKALNDFKEGPNYITNMKRASESLEKDREKAKKATSPKPYQDMLQNRPRKPSEAFLAINENKFPINHLEDAFIKLTSKESQLASHWTGFIRYVEEQDENGRSNKVLKFRSSSKIPLRQWPQPKNSPTDGPIEIFEMPKLAPDGQAYPNRYLAATDPVDDDDINGSLQSTFIYDMWTHRIVAEYTARTYQVEDYWENTRLLLMFYNAICNYEANKKGFYGHMRNKNSLHLLSDTPSILRDLDLAIIKDVGNKSKGTIATKGVNEYGRKLYNIWLKKAAEGRDGLTNAQCLRSLGLVNESIQYNPNGNFDRISAVEKLFILVADKEQSMGGDNRKEINEAAAGLAADPFFTKNYDRFLKKNGRLNFTKINHSLKSA